MTSSKTLLLPSLLRRTRSNSSSCCCSSSPQLTHHLSTTAHPGKTDHSFSPILTLDTLAPSCVRFNYAVRGELAIQAEKLRSILSHPPPPSSSSSPPLLPFTNIVNCNIGNPQQLLQKPITFFRQVSALLEFPDLASSPLAASLFPADVRLRAAQLLQAAGGSIGAYSHSQGVPLIRERIAQFIQERDGLEHGSANPNDIFLTAGASPGVQMVLQSIISHPKVGIMIPIPQYPLYSGSIEMLSGNAVSYYLDEENNWGLSVHELERSLKHARDVSGLDVRALCVINPGNPTGQCLSESNMREIIKFCHDNRLVLLADEVYQTNIYLPQQLPFHSFRKVLKSLGDAYSNFELVSFHSISKGMVGECGRRGGYFECIGMQQEVKDVYYKMLSLSLCPPVQGQVMVELMVNPPKPGDESWELYNQETSSILASLKRRAVALAEGFNSLEGVTCNPAQGSMYLFPKICLPSRAIEAAEAAGKLPDVFYCLALLNATGVCVVPGSGFLQKKDTWHFRSTFLPPEHQMEEFIGRIKTFHASFMDIYR